MNWEENSSEPLAVQIEMESLSELQGFGHSRFGADMGPGCPISTECCHDKHTMPVWNTEDFLWSLRETKNFSMNAFYSLSSQTQSCLSIHALNFTLKTLQLGVDLIFLLIGLQRCPHTPYRYNKGMY